MINPSWRAYGRARNQTEMTQMAHDYRITVSYALDVLRAYGYKARASAGDIVIQEPVVTPNGVTYRPYTTSPAGAVRFVRERN